MAGDAPSLIVRVAANYQEWKQNTAEMQNQIEVTRQGLARMSAAFDGSKIIQQAHATAAAIQEIGGTAKLTDAEMAKANATLDAAIQKYAALGREAPAGLRQLADATQGATGPLGDLKHLLSEGFENPIGAIKTLASEVGGGLTEGLGAAGIAASVATTALVGLAVVAVELGEKAAAIGGNLFEMSEKTGIAVPALSKLSYAAQVAGSDINTLSNGVFMMQKNMELSPDKFEKGLARIGVSLKELQGLSPDQQFIRIAEGLEKQSDSAQRDAASFEMFNRQGRELLPTMMELGKAMEMTAGITPWTTAEAEQAKEFEMEVAVLKLRFEQIGVAIGKDVLPFLKAFVDHLDTAKTVIEHSPIGWLIDRLHDLGEAYRLAAAAADMLRGKQLELPAVQGGAPKIDVMTPFAAPSRDEALTTQKSAIRELEEEHRKLAAAQRKAAEEAQRWAAVMGELDSAGEGWKGTLDTIDGSVVEAIKYYIAAGVSQNTLAKAYGLTETQIRSVVSALKDEAAALKVRNELAKVETGVALTGPIHGLTTVNIKEQVEATQGAAVAAYLEYDKKIRDLVTATNVLVLEKIDEQEQAELKSLALKSSANAEYYEAAKRKIEDFYRLQRQLAEGTATDIVAITHSLGLKTREEWQAEADRYHRMWETLKADGTHSAEAIQAAWERYQAAMEHLASDSVLGRLGAAFQQFGKTAGGVIGTLITQVGQLLEKWNQMTTAQRAEGIAGTAGGAANALTSDAEYGSKAWGYHTGYETGSQVFGPLGGVAGGLAGLAVVALSVPVKEKAARAEFIEWQGRTISLFRQMGSAAEQAAAGSDRYAQMNAMIDKAAKGMGFDPAVMQQRVREALAATHDDPEAVKAALAPIQAMLDKFAEMSKSVRTGADDIKSRLSDIGYVTPQIAAAMEEAFKSDNLQTANDWLASITRQLDDQQKQFQKTESVMSKYGLDWTKMGEQGKGQKMAELSKGFVDDFQTMLQAGVSKMDIGQGMGKNLTEFVKQAQAAGVQVPLAMKPVLQAAIDAGTLFDSAGHKVSNLNDLHLTFGDQFAQVVQTMGDKLDELMVRLGLKTKEETDAFKRAQQELLEAPGEAGPGYAGGIAAAAQAGAEAGKAFTDGMNTGINGGRNTGVNGGVIYWDPAQLEKFRQQMGGVTDASDMAGGQVIEDWKKIKLQVDTTTDATGHVYTQSIDDALRKSTTSTGLMVDGWDALTAAIMRAKQAAGSMPGAPPPGSTLPPGAPPTTTGEGFATEAYVRGPMLAKIGEVPELVVRPSTVAAWMGAAALQGSLVGRPGGSGPTPVVQHVHNNYFSATVHTENLTTPEDAVAKLRRELLVGNSGLRQDIERIAENKILGPLQ